MSSDEQSSQRSSEFPAVGASGAIGILPNGFFAKKLSGVQPAVHAAQTNAPRVEEERKLPDRG